LDGYLESRTDLKIRTRWKLRTTRDRLIDFFGAGKAMREISPGHADEFRLHLVKEGLVENSVRKPIAIAKQFFRVALRKRLIDENPFAGLKASVLPNRERFFFVTRGTADRVLGACPDAQWRLLFSLARFGGLRVPSEALALRWSDVNWADNRILIHSVKTEHHGPDKATRTIPLFPELAAPLS
jgi:integrase